MAENNNNNIENPVNTMQPKQYYCHSCLAVVTVTAGYTCARCNGGFIEEMRDIGELPVHHSNLDLTVTLSFDSDNNHTVSITVPHSNNSELNDTPPALDWSNTTIFERFHERLGRNSLRSLFDDADILGQFFSAELENLSRSPRFMLPLMRVNQTQERIDRIPVVKISEEDIAKCDECSICWESFVLGESVHKLPCSHVFHGNCVVPWLKQCCTCPICRNDLLPGNKAE